MRPVAIDLFCGLGGWTDGLLAEGYDVFGFDIEQHVYGEHRYPAQLIVQDVLTLHGSQFKGVDLIVASPPCQEFSYMAMPWSLAKEKQRAIEADPAEQKRLTALFDACFRIQKEACEAAGHHIPMVVENVRGAQKWVGRSRWNFGSFHLWGDVPALMPIAKAVKVGGLDWSAHADPDYKTSGKAGCFRDSAFKVPSIAGRRTDIGNGARFTSREQSGVKQAGISGARDNGKGDAWFQDGAARHGSKSKARKARKAASAMIAKIPLPLSTYIAQVFKPEVA
jgi:hypothetical protein